MKKINLRQPKYIIPLIILPFLFAGFYFYTLANDGDRLSAQDVAGSDGINPGIPEANSNETLNKLEAFKESLKLRRKNTAVSDLEQEGHKKITDEQDSLAHKRDSIKMAYNEALQKRKEARERRDLERREKLIERSNAQGSGKGGRSENQIWGAQTKENREMENFKAQMRVLDSMQHPERYALDNDQKTDSVPEIEKLRISKESSISSGHFYTIKANRDETFVKALLDEGIKVWEGSRVRIRLLEDVFIEEISIKKGKYLFGTVSNFSQQRVTIEITSVLDGDKILPVDISLYDNDGIEGIYVPDSAFRDFAKQLGEVQASNANNVNFNQNSESSTQLMYKGISSAMQSTSKAIRESFRKNKATLKYNTQVYLVNSN